MSDIETSAPLRAARASEKHNTESKPPLLKPEGKQMNYSEACLVFDVTHTPRQKRKWNNEGGRAYKLARSLSDQIRSRKIQNEHIRQDNKRIAATNQGRENDDLDPLALAVELSLFTDLEMRRCLNQ